MAKKPKDPKPKTEGQRQLLEQEGSEAEIAARIGCGPAVIGHWRRGRRVPGEALRHKIELLFGIPRRAWDVEPGTSLDAPSPKAGAPSSKLRGDGDGTLTITKAQIDAILEELKDDSITDTAAAKLRDTLAKLLALRSRLERDRDLLEDRVVREHPEWARLKASILTALKPYPEATRDIIEALK